MGLAPRLKNGIDLLLVSVELAVGEDGSLYLLGFHEWIAVSGSTVGFKQGVAEYGKDRPIVVECVDIGVRDAAVEVCAKVMQVFGFTGIDIARDIKVIVVGRVGNFRDWHHAGVAG